MRMGVWTDGKYIVINIPKVNTPQISKFGISVERTVGGISIDNPSPFIRFNDSANYDMKKELLRIFPGIEDSLKNIQKVEVGGEPIIIKKR